MLEHANLLVHPWTLTSLPDGTSTWLRRIIDDAERPLGFVRFDGPADSSWLSWLRPVRLDVFETEDASHLMTLTRAWGMLRVWDVHDAEDRHVGSVHPKALLDSENATRGFFDKQSGGRGRILDPTGGVLAHYGRKGDGVLDLTFLPAPLPNPFLRMLILSAVLSLEPAPKPA